MSLAAVLERSKHEREAWKYTDLEKLLATIAPETNKTKTPGSTPAAPSIFAESIERHQLVFVGNELRRDRSQIGELPFDIVTGDPQTGYTLTLAGHTCLITAPIELVFLAAEGGAAETALQLAITLGESGRLTLIEHHPARGGAFVAETDIKLGKQAKLTHGKIVAGAGAHLAATRVDVAEGGYYDNFTLMKDGRLTRNEIAVRLLGKSAQSSLNGVMLLGGAAHADTWTHITHAAPFSTSRENYKSVVTGKAKGVFQGRITVAEGAVKTDGQQSSKALLLSDQAEMDAKPELEIFADDVKCSHGCATGDLDADALFYLRARGLDEKEACALLIRGFVDDVLDDIHMPEWRDFCRAQTEGWLHEQD